MINNDKPNICVVIPCYNEEEVLPETIIRLTLVLDDLVKDNLISNKSTVLLVDDGSKDATWRLIENFNSTNSFITGLKLAKNVGHQNALFAGLMHSKTYADAVISIDADLQDDINTIREFVNKFLEGFDIVYGVRSSRKKDTLFKRFTAESFYRLIQTMGVNIIYNHADYRLMSKRALEQLQNYKEVNLFLRGIIPTIGFNSTIVYYERNERFAGESKYPLKKMLSFALDGITSFSIKPIRFITVVGFFMFIFSILAALIIIINKVAGKTTIGWTSIMISIWFIGGIQIMCLGLIGEYIGKIYKEVKQRPKYIIDYFLSTSSSTVQHIEVLKASQSYII